MENTLYENLLILDSRKDEFPKKLYKNISNIIWNYTGKTKRELEIDNKDLKTKEVLKIGKEIYEEALETNELVKLMISLCIFDFCNYEMNMLELEKKQDLLEKLESAFSSIRIEVQVPDDAPYNEKKLYEILEDAEKTGNIKQRFEVMETLRNHSNTFAKVDFTWILFIRVLWMVHKETILKTIANKNTITMELILFSLDSYIEELSTKKIESEYLEIRIASLLSYKVEQKYLKNNVNDFSKLPDLSNYYYNFFSLRGNTIIEYKNTFHFLHLRSLSYYAGCICTQKTELCDYFINFISFTSDQIGQAFSIGFLNHCEEGKTLIKIGERILSKLLDSEIKYYSSFNEYYGFLDLFLNYFRALEYTQSIFLTKINELNTMISTIHSSWDFSKITKTWFSLWLLIFSNKLYMYKFSQQELEKVASNLFDKRNQLALDVSNDVFENMISLLKEPENVTEIIASKNHKEFRLSLMQK